MITLTRGEPKKRSGHPENSATTGNIMDFPSGDYLEVTSGNIRTSSLLQPLTTEQRLIIESVELKIMIEADAGAAKTEVLVRKVAYDIITGQVPNNVPIVTFSKKAAKELLNRFVGLVYEPGKLEIKTLHALCFDIIKANFQDFGFSYKPTFLEDSDKRDFFKKQLQIFNNYDSDVLSSVLSNYSLAHNLSKEGRKDWCQALPLLEHMSFQILEAYQLYKQKGNFIDYEDMQVLVYDVLSINKVLLDKVQRTVPAIYIDEVQDNSEIQWDIIQLLNAPRIFAVGDKKQQIYSWRGSRQDFESKVPGAKKYLLQQNWRSTPQIVAVANKVFGSKSFSKKSNGPKPVLMSGWDRYSEAVEVVSLIEKLDGCGSLAVLARNWNYLRAVQMLLSFRGIPYENNDGVITSSEFVRFIEIAKWTYTQNFIYLSKCQEALGLRNNPKRLIKDLQPAFPGLGLEESEVDLMDKLKEIHSRKLPSYEFFDVLYNDFYKVFIGADQKLKSVQEKFNRFKCDLSFWQSKHSKSAITLSSVHSVKGGKFTNVILVGLADGIFPDFRQENLEEEERLFYVGLTRAEYRLFLSFPIKDKYGRNSRRSPLINLIDEPHLISYDVPEQFEHHEKMLSVRDSGQVDAEGLL